ncbi:MAG TPA: hypothetical protein VIF60_08520 [Burkholderiaceae bacterium]
MESIRNPNMYGIRRHQIVAIALAILAHTSIAFMLASASEQPSIRKSNERIVTISLDPADRRAEAVIQSATESATFSGQQSDKPENLRGAEKSIPDPKPMTTQQEPRYYRTSELTVPPVVSQDVLAIQPLKLAGGKPEIVILRLLVNEKGEIDQVLVENSELSIESTKLLVERFSMMKFEPGKIAGEPVRSQLTIEVDASPFH